jgi:hypothetical protein
VNLSTFFRSISRFTCGEASLHLYIEVWELMLNDNVLCRATSKELYSIVGKTVQDLQRLCAGSVTYTPALGHLYKCVEHRRKSVDKRLITKKVQLSETAVYLLCSARTTV